MGARRGGGSPVPLSRAGRAAPAPWPPQGAVGGRRGHRPHGLGPLRSAPGAQVSLGVGCRRGHGGGCEGHPGGRAGGRGLREAGRLSGGLGRPWDTARGESGVWLPSRAGRGLSAGPGQRGFVRGPSEYLEQLLSLSRRPCSPGVSPGMRCCAREKRLRSPPPVPIPDRGRRDAGGREGSLSLPEPRTLPIPRAVLRCKRGFLTLPPQTRCSPRWEGEAGEGERGFPNSEAPEGAPGGTGKGQLPKRAGEETLRSVLGAFSPWSSSDTRHVLLGVEFSWLGSIWVNSRRKSADVAHIHRPCLTELLRAALPAAGRTSRESATVSHLTHPTLP